MNHKNNRTSKEVPHLGPEKEWQYWTQKWGVSEKRLSEAIEQTRTDEVERVEEYLRSHKYI